MNRKTSPPRALRFLKWFCPQDLHESIEGDLLEQFAEDEKIAGTKIAHARLVWNVVKFFRPGIILRNKFSIQIIDTVMLRNYLTIALRNVVKNKVFSAINILGLGIG